MLKFMTTRASRLAGGLLAGICAMTIAAAQETPQRGGTLVFPIHSGEATTYDCHAAPAIRIMQRVAPHYSLLIKVDPDRYPEVQGDLAKSWKVSPDGLSYEFKLHEGVKFHDGTLLTSKDVKVSYERMISPPPGVVSMRRGMLLDIQSIETPDPLTVVFKLSSPNAAMLQLLAMPYACIYSAKLLAEDSSYPGKRVMGSGPFRFVRYAPGSEWVGERFEGYFRAGLPYLDGFKALSVTVPAANNALVAGSVMFNVRALTASEVATVLAARGDKVKIVGQSTAVPVSIWVSVNTERGPLADARVRRALTLAFDRWGGAKSMQQFTPINMVGGLLRPGSTFARTPQELQKLPGFSPDIEASRREARRLLAEAGHPNLKVGFLNTANFANFGVFVTDQLRQIGVTVDHQLLDQPSFIARRLSGNYDLTMDTPPEYMDDPTVQWAVFKPHKNNPVNFSRTSDNKLDDMYELQKRTMDVKERAKQVRELEAYILNQAYVLPLFWGGWSRAISTQVGGLGDTPTNYVKLDLVDIWLRPPARP